MTRNPIFRIQTTPSRVWGKYKSGTLTVNCMVHSKDQRFEMNKAMLTSAFPYFAEILASDDELGALELPDEVRPEVFSKFIDYFSHGQLACPFKEICDVLKGAEVLQLEFIFTQLFDKLSTVLSSDNCFQLLRMADTRRLHQVADLCMKYVSDNISKFSTADKLEDLNYTYLRVLLRSKEYPAEFEKLLFNRFMNILDRLPSHEKRSAYLKDLLDDDEMQQRYFKVFVSTSNCFDLAEFSLKHQLMYLHGLICDFIAKNFWGLIKNNNFLQCSAKIFIKTLHSRSRPEGSNEQPVWELINRWIEHDVQNRSKFVYDCLRGVRLTRIQEMSFLEARMLCNPHVFASNQAKLLVHQAMSFQRYPSERKALFNAMKLVHPMPRPPSVATVISGVENTASFQLTGRKQEEFRWKSVGPTVEGSTSYAAALDDCIIFYDRSNKRWFKIDPSFQFTELDSQFSASAMVTIEPNRFAAAEIRGKNYLVAVFDENLNRLNELPALPKMDRPSVAFLNDELYLISGKREGSYSSEVNRFLLQGERSEWTRTAELINARFMHASTVLDGCIYVLCGNNSGYLSSVERFDPRTSKWQSVNGVSVARQGLGAVVHGNEIWAIGGYADGVLKTVEVYDSRANQWRLGPSLPNGAYVPAVVSFPLIENE